MFSSPGQDAYVNLCNFEVQESGSNYSSLAMTGVVPYELKNYRARISLLRAPEEVSFAAEFVAYFTSYRIFYPLRENKVKQSPFGWSIMADLSEKTK